MLWQNKKQSQTTPQPVGMYSMGVQRNPYENFEKEYRQESEIHRRWQRIEDTALIFKRKYEQNSDILEYIDIMRSTEKIFVKGKIKNWSNEQIRGELVRNHIEDMSSIGKIDKAFAQQVYEEFKLSSASAAKVDEVTRILLEKYAERPEYCSFILYLRDVSIAYMQSHEKGESNDAFKDRLIAIRMEVIAGHARVSISELKQIYEEFKLALSAE
jgi:hypothetical protein